jgi:hypothetical protein
MAAIKTNWMLTKTIAKSGYSYVRTSTLDEHLQNYEIKFIDFNIFIFEALTDMTSI